MPPATQIEGKYEILEKLHEGGMGAIYKVRHLLLGGIRVVKVIRPQLGGGAEFKERFLREAKIAFRLPHRNIAQLFDFSVDAQGNAYIVMEFIDGVNLEEVIERPGSAGLPLALEITHQALSALAVLHRKGFIHRDISPDNLMLTRDEEHRPLVKLIDLGIAKELGSESNLTRAGAFVGKLKYCPPERLKSEGDTAVDARSDLYAFGIVLYELLTGTHPIQGRDTASIVGGQLFRDPVPFSESDPDGRVPEEVRAIVLRSLEKRPEDRFQSARELREALEPYRRQHPASERDLDRALSSAPPTVRIQVQKPGSTQNRLDAQFGAGATTPSGRTPGHQQTVSSSPPTTAQDEPAEPPPSSTMVAPMPGKRKAAAQTPPPLPPEDRAASEATFAETPQPTVADERGLGRQQRQLVDDIRQALAEGDVATARKNLEILRAIAPDSDEVAELDRLVAAPEPSETDLAGAAAERIEAALERWDLAEAERLLVDARQQSPDASWAELEGRIDEIRRGEAISDAAAKINQLIASGELDSASEALTEASAEHGEVELLRLARLRLDDARQQRDAALVAAVEEATQQIEAGELDAADAAIAELAAAHGQREEIARLRETLESARARQKLDHDLQAARQALDANDPATAMIRIDSALGLDEGSTEALQLQKAAKKQLSKQQKEERRADIQRRVGEIEASLAAGEHAAAEEQIVSAEVAHPDEARWQELTAELAAAKEQRARAVQAEELRAEATALLSSDDAKEALERAQQAQKLAPDDPRIRELIDAASKAVETAREAAEAATRKRQLDDAIDQIRSALAAGSLDTATSRLAEATSTLGDDPAFSDVREELERARQAAEEREQHAEEERRQLEQAERRRRQIAEVVSSVRASLSDGNYDRAAAQLEDGEAVLGAFSEADELRQEIATQRQQEQHAKQLQTSAAEIERTLAAGDLAGARQRLDTAERDLGPQAALQELRKQLEAAETRRSEERAAAIEKARTLVAQGELDTAAALLDEVGEDPSAASVRQELAEQRAKIERAQRIEELTRTAEEQRADGRLDDAARLLEEALELDASAQAVRTSLDEVRRQITERDRAHARVEAAKRIEPLIAGGKIAKASKLLDRTVSKWGDGEELVEVRAALEAARKEPTTETPVAADEVSTRPKWLLPAIAAALVVCVIVVIVWVAGRGESPQPPPITGNCQLIVDAAPWGEVTAIVGEDGSRIALPEDRFTPLLVTLPAGTYTITVRHPELDATLQRTVEITPDGTARSLAEFDTGNVDGLLDRLGM